MTKAMMFVFLLFSSFGYSATKVKVCDNLYSLASISKMEMINIKATRWSLKEFIELGLLQKSPINLMHSGQRMASWVESVKPVVIRDPIYNAGEIKIYPTFSGWAPEYTDGYRIVGNYSALSEIGNYISNQALGDKVGGKVLLITGTSGTGKSELGRVVSKLSARLSEAKESFFLYSYEWTDLHLIPGLAEIYTPVEIGEKTIFNPVAAQMGDSPFVLLPESYQAKIIEEANELGREMMGSDLSPYLKLDPHSENIVKELITYYKVSDPEKYENITDDLYLEILNNHVRVKRVIKTDEQMFPLISAQGKDPDMNGLFIQDNPLIKMTRSPGHPNAYYLNGKALTGHGGMVIFDELFRNSQEFLDFLLESFESRLVQLGGSKSISLDTVPIAITNTESIIAATQDGGALKATVDRMKRVNMDLSVVPQEIAGTVLLMSSGSFGRGGVEMRSLLGEVNLDQKPEMNWEKFDYNKVFPAPINGNLKNGKLLDLKRRYALKVRVQGGKQILIPPHLLETLSAIVAATRMVTDEAAAVRQQMGKFHVLKDSLFTDPVTRIRYFRGELGAEITNAQERELKTLNIALNEGSTGISMRDAASNWFIGLIDHARTNNLNVVTYQSLIEVFSKQLVDRKITVTKGSPKIRTEWMLKAENIMTRILVPEIEQDIYAAINNKNRNVDNIYEEMVATLAAIDTNAAATTYQIDGVGPEQSINFERLGKIREIYKSEYGKMLTTGGLFNTMRSGDGLRKWQPLIKCINKMLAQSEVTNNLFNNIYSISRRGASGNGEGLLYSTFERYMIEKFGYDESSIKSALDIVKQARNKNQRK